MVGSGYRAADGPPSLPPVHGAGPRPLGPSEPTSADGRETAAWYRAEVHHTSHAASGAVTNSSVIVESTHGRVSGGHAVCPSVTPPAASVPVRRLRHPSPPPLARGRDQRLALQLSAAAIEAARVNAPLPMPAYPRLDVGDAGYVGTLLQWQNEGRLSARKHEAVDGGVSSKLARMQQ